ncbi:hypothetical protein CDL15_Pgr009220 [Punica granatum]|uniref:Uncharacterized protein n=1 Tax=Punica granatum TaxID=22663 RepID=A0A218WV35_PUNGR|nr:hypothetical protein CDL15_Pgr009220 [Punica granatum]
MLYYASGRERRLGDLEGSQGPASGSGEQKRGVVGCDCWGCCCGSSGLVRAAEGTVVKAVGGAQAAG